MLLHCNTTRNVSQYQMAKSLKCTLKALTTQKEYFMKCPMTCARNSVKMKNATFTLLIEKCYQLKILKVTVTESDRSSMAYKHMCISKEHMP
jgi:hypothetical protein